MSIVEKLVKLVDPAEAKRREEERRKDREQPQRAETGEPPHAFECRVCGHQGNESDFCPTCLAATMQKIR